MSFSRRVVEIQAENNSNNIYEKISRLDFKFYINGFSKAKNDFEKLLLLDKLTDEINKSITSNTACRDSCNHCCHQSVLIFPEEIKRIQQTTGMQFSGGYKSPRELLSSISNFDGVKCPFLKDSKCSIYAVRPTLCRLYFNISDTSDLCIKSKNHNIDVPIFNYEFLVPLIGDILTSCVGNIHQFRS